MLQADVSDAWSVVKTIASLFMSAIGGALVVLVTFRTRLALLDKEIELRKAEIEKLRKDAESEARSMRGDVQRIITDSENRIMSRIAAFDRRQRFMLEIVADFARATGTDKRLGDKVLTFLADEMATGRDD